MVQQACWQTPSAHSSCSGAPWSCNSFRRCQCQTKEARHGSDLHQAPSALRSGRVVNKSTHSYREGASSARRRRRTMRCAQPPPLTSTVMRMMKKVHVSITSPLPSGANTNDQETFTREAWQPPTRCVCAPVLPGRTRQVKNAPCSDGVHTSEAQTNLGRRNSPGRSCTACSDSANAMAPRSPDHHSIACTRNRRW